MIETDIDIIDRIYIHFKLMKNLYQFTRKSNSKFPCKIVS